MTQEERRKWEKELRTEGRGGALPSRMEGWRKGERRERRNGWRAGGEGRSVGCGIRVTPFPEV